MLDVRLTGYVVPVAEQPLDSITPVVRVQNFADENGTVTGLIRIYRESTGLLEYSSELTVTQVTHGTTVEIAALTPFDPGAPADDDYFIIASIHARTLVPFDWHECDSQLGPYYFDVKPGPMGPAPAAHHVTHEAGGMDPIDLTNMTGLTATPQTPAPHAPTHEDGGADQLEVSNLATSELDDSLVLHPDGAGGVEWEAAGAGVTDHGALTGLADDDHPQYRLRLEVFWETECLLSSAGSYPWYQLAIAAGTIAPASGSSSHPGINRITSSTTTNSGFYKRFHSAALVLAGSEVSTYWHRPQTLSGTTRRTGFHDTSSVTAPVDGAYIYQDPATGKITGRTMAASAGSTTGTDYQLVTATWYLEKIVVNADATRVDFYLYDDAGALLWTDFLTTNIPTSWLGHGTVVTNSGTTAVDLDDVDYMSIRIPNRRPNV